MNLDQLNHLKKQHFLWFSFTFFFVACGLFFSTKMPVITAWLINSDQLTIPAFIVDVFHDHTHFFGWQLPRATFIFPDALVYSFFYGLGLDPINSIVYSSSMISFLWIYLAFCCFPKINAISFSKKFAWILFFCYWLPFLLSQLSPNLSDFIFKYLFSFFNHFSCFVFSALCMVWMIDYLCNESERPSLIFIISFIVFLLTFSNPLIYIYFGIPFLILSCITYPSANNQRRARLMYLTGALFIAILLGYLLGDTINKQIIMPMHPLSEIFTQVKIFFYDLFVFYTKSASTALMFIMYFMIYSISLLQCSQKIRLFFRQQLSSNAERDFLLQAVFTMAGLFNFFSAVPPWDNLASARYLMFFLFSPFLLVPFLISKSKLIYSFVFSNRTLIISSIILTITSFYALQHADLSLNILKHEKNKASSLNDCVTKLGLHRGLSRYWSARQNQFMSYNQLHLSQMHAGGLSQNTLLFYWGNNAYSFLQTKHDKNPFDYILANHNDHLDKPIFIDAIGKPDKIARCGKHEIWIYRNPHTLFSALIKGHNEPYLRYLKANGHVSLPAIAFHRLTGQPSGFAMEAYPNKNKAGFILYGNYMPLSSGSYDFNLNYRLSGDIESNSFFEVLKNGGTLAVARRSISPYEREKIGSISLTINLAKNTVVEPRVFYNGKGTLHIDSLTVKKMKTIPSTT